MRSITVSVPGKIHLSGEHAVVYGKPAVLATVSKRLHVSLTTQNQDFRTKNNLEEIRKKDKYIDEIVKIVEKNYQLTINKLHLTIRSEIPTGAGMGSSAALAVALVAALIKWFNKPWLMSQINEMAYEAEKFKHGQPSGGDNSIVTYGGWLWYRKEFEFLKTFWRIPLKIPNTWPNFVLISTGRSEITGDIVKMVAGKFKKYPNQADLLNKMENITKQFVQAIYDHDLDKFKQAIVENEKTLEELDVVSNLAQKLIGDINRTGGIAKISGAGGIKTGSGVLLCLHDKPQKIINIARNYNFPAFQVKLGEEGVKIESVQ